MAKKQPPKKKKHKPTQKKATSTALVKRAPMPMPKPVAALPPDHRMLTNDIMLGDLGLVELKLTPEEEAILAQPVDVKDIRVKPTGAAYLPHIVYTRWFNKAFGRLGWNIVPVSKPTLQGKSVVTPYVLYVHKLPVAAAYGEQEYFDNNRDQTYGDALESTVASGLRRCAKRIGVSLEMWDREFLDAYMDEHAVKVRVEVKDREGHVKKKYQFRRQIDPPFWNEISGRRGRQDEDDDEGPEPAQRRTPARPSPPPQPQETHHAGSDDPVTQAQRQRLFAILRSSGRQEQEVRDWLHKHWGWTSTGQITRRHYNNICTWIEAPGPLPEEVRR